MRYVTEVTLPMLPKIPCYKEMCISGISPVKLYISIRHSGMITVTVVRSVQDDDST